MAAILIVEDDLTFATMLKTWLGKQGFQISTAGDLSKAHKFLEHQSYDLILSDLRLPEGDGLSLLDWMQKHGLVVPLIVMTSYADVQNAVNAMKQGACDYIAKPVQPAMLLEKIEDALSASSPTLSKRNTDSEEAQTGAEAHPAFLEGKSEAARQLYNYVALVAPTPLSVLINGASGTGKEYVAHRIHQLSKRADKPFVAIDCGAMLKELAASEFFGHVKGSFTGAVADKTGAFVEANGGTLFLDEIGELPPHIQSKLLQLIQEKTIERLSGTQKIELDFRLIVATNRNLEEEVQRGLFRSDLFYRLNVIRIHIPPLRQRKEDIFPLANQFLARFSGEYGKNLTFSPRFLAFLEQYDWPGNVRQLENLIERLVITVQDPIIDTTALPVEYTGDAVPPAELLAQQGSLAERMDAYERQIIRESYRRCGTTVAVAKELGISQATAVRKIAKYVKDRKE